jgi:hypothetical protein
MIRMTKLTLKAILLALALVGCRSSMDTAAAAYLAMVTETDVSRDAINAEFRASNFEPARRGPALVLSVAWREDFIRRLDRLEFPDQVRDQVTALRAAEVALVNFERTLAASLPDPYVFRYPDPVYPAAGLARDEMRRVLGLPKIQLPVLVQESFPP